MVGGKNSKKFFLINQHLDVFLLTVPNSCSFGFLEGKYFPSVLILQEKVMLSLISAELHMINLLSKGSHDPPDEEAHFILKLVSFSFLESHIGLLLIEGLGILTTILSAQAFFSRVSCCSKKRSVGEEHLHGLALLRKLSKAHSGRRLSGKTTFTPSCSWNLFCQSALYVEFDLPALFADLWEHPGCVCFSHYGGHVSCDNHEVSFSFLKTSNRSVDEGT